LLQEVDGQKPFLYSWTASLAQRPDMKPISSEEARKFVTEARTEEKRQREARIRADAELEASKDEQLPIEEEYPDAHPSVVLENIERIEQQGEARDDALSSQDDLLAVEFKKIEGFRKPALLEEYLLRKYRIPLLEKPLADMKIDAKVALTALGKDQKLFKLVE
jgi:hypothetical protein